MNAIIKPSLRHSADGYLRQPAMVACAGATIDGQYDFGGETPRSTTRHPLELLARHQHLRVPGVWVHVVCVLQQHLAERRIDERLAGIGHCHLSTWPHIHEGWVMLWPMC